MDCKKALSECKGDLEQAVKLLRTKGLADVAKRASRTANEGLVDSYIHAGGKIGVMVEVNSETDFVARNNDFKAFVHDIAMHIAAAAPRYISRDDVPQEVVDAEMAIYTEQAKATGKPDNILEKIATGKLNKFYSQVCLLEQPFIKDEDMKVEQTRGHVVSKSGEKIEHKPFARFDLGKVGGTHQ